MQQVQEGLEGKCSQFQQGRQNETATASQYKFLVILQADLEANSPTKVYMRLLASIDNIYTSTSVCLMWDIAQHSILFTKVEHLPNTTMPN